MVETSLWARWVHLALIFSLFGCRHPGPHPSKAASSTAKPTSRTDAKETPHSNCEPSASACFRRAEAGLESSVTQAESALTECLRCEGVPPAAYRLLATLQSERGVRNEARSTLQQGVRRYSASVSLWRALGRVELSLSRWREGLSALGTAYRLSPNANGLEEEYRHALAQFGTNEDRVENAVHALLLEATGRFELDDKKGTLQVLKAALKASAQVDRLRALVHHRIGLVYLANVDFKHAAIHHKRALQRTPEPALRVEILSSYAETLIGLKRYPDAIAQARTALSSEPRNALAYANLAIAQSMNAQPDDAMKSFTRAFEFGLARRITAEQFLALGTAVDRLRHRPDFTQLVDKTWPNRPTDRAPALLP